MSTISSAIFVESDDEHDADFVPENEPESSDEEAPAAAQPKQDPLVSEAEKAAKERARRSLWESFQASVAATSGTSSTNASKRIKFVKVERKYRFAGEEVSEIVEVPEDSEDAKKWPRWTPHTEEARTNEARHEAGRTAEATPRTSEATAPPALPEQPGSTTMPGKLEHSAVKPPPQLKPGPRKPKTLLAPLPSGKPKKLTTLEKSAMDWRAHISQSGSTAEAPCAGNNIADELEQNRRSGGYLEKVAFLERVEYRREELFDETRKKRRKG